MERLHSQLDLSFSAFPSSANEGEFSATFERAGNLFLFEFWIPE